MAPYVGTSDVAYVSPGSLQVCCRNPVHHGCLAFRLGRDLAGHGQEQKTVDGDENVGFPIQSGRVTLAERARSNRGASSPEVFLGRTAGLSQGLDDLGATEGVDPPRQCISGGLHKEARGPQEGSLSPHRRVHQGVFSGEAGTTDFVTLLRIESWL